MTGELSRHDRLRPAIRMAGKVLVAVGVAAILAGLIVSTPRTYNMLGVIIVLSGAVVSMLGSHLWLGRKWTWIALFIDACCLFFMSFPLSEVVGLWAYALAAFGLLMGVLLVVWGLRAEPDDDANTGGSHGKRQ